MKRLVSIGLLLLTLSVHAQTDYDWRAHRHDLSIAGGYMSGIYPLRSILITAWQNIGDNGGDVRYCGDYTLSYHYQALWWLRAGAKVQWEGDYWSFYSREDQAKSIAMGKTMNHCFSFMTSCQFTYLNREHVRLYSGLDAGLGIFLSDKRYINGNTNSDGKQREVQTSFLPAFNLTAFGVAFGGERVYGLAELNLGYDALLTLGIGCRM